MFPFKLKVFIVYHTLLFQIVKKNVISCDMTPIIASVVKAVSINSKIVLPVLRMSISIAYFTFFSVLI